MTEIRVRFAPSPTGPLHIGGARSALFNYLFARQLDGKFILRIEDTDQARSRRESEKDIYKSLEWLGLTWDEGPDRGGEYGPYRQTERLSFYEKYTQELLAAGQAYYCFCSEAELEAERQKARQAGRPPMYSGKCRTLSPVEREKYLAQGRQPVIRFQVPANQAIIIDDLVRGRVVFRSEDIGDFIIVKSDGLPTYNYAVVIDDALMKISHVIRAEEHLSNTPRQILLYQALGFPLPHFAHVSLILGKDRSKMSKRHGATSVIQYQKEGYLPEAVVNFLALLGWAPEGEAEKFSMAELIEQFSLERVAKNPAVFDLEKLRWLNSLYLKDYSSVELTNLAVPYLVAAGLLTPTPAEVKWVETALSILGERLITVKDVVEKLKPFIGETVEIVDEKAHMALNAETAPLVLKTFREQLIALDEITPEGIQAILKTIIKDLKLKGKEVYMPLRAALIGQAHGPELQQIIAILGKDLTLRRLANVLA